MTPYLIGLVCYCIAMWAISIPLFNPNDNVGNHTIRLFAPIALPVIGAAWALGRLVRMFRNASVTLPLAILSAAGITGIVASGHGLAYVLVTYALGVIYLGVMRYEERAVRPIPLQIAIFAPITVPLLGMVALEEFLRNRRKPPAAPEPEKPADTPPQDG